MTKHTESALTAFSLLNDAIGEVVADAKQEAKDAIENESANAVDLATRQKALTDIAERVRSLRDEFRSVISGDLPVNPPPPPPPSFSSPQTKLVVMFADGTRLDYHNATETFVASLQKMGLHRVLSLNEKVSRAPLVSKERNGRVQQKSADGYWIITHSDTSGKKRILDKVAKRLEERVIVKIVDK